MQAQTWNVRPSNLLAIEDEYDAYCLDEACAEWGAYVRSELEKITGKSTKSVEGKRMLLLQRLLEGEVRDQYRQPVVTKKE